MSDWREPLSSTARSIRLAQTIAHQASFTAGDKGHSGEPRRCTRPLCLRLLEDAAAVEYWGGTLDDNDALLALLHDREILTDTHPGSRVR